ncbi:MAG: hypothetical protein AMXMBFR22_31610 [Phycisphaerae bacterium]
MWLMFGESWEADGKDKDDCPDNYEITWGREFRYDAARARYMNRELDPVELQTYGYTVSLSDTWSDYNGDVIYGDWSVEAGSPPTVTQLHNYQPGLGENGTPGSSTGLRYAHSDPLGTLRSHTDASCAASASFAYTAFGERVDGGAFQRHSYAGAWGYQAGDFPSGNPAAFLHVGMRWYDPAIGRFLQRDPIGITGGLNVYEYVFSCPAAGVDPTGLTSSLNHPEAGAVFADLEALGYSMGRHAAGRAAQYAVSESRVINCIRTGEMYWSPAHRSINYVSVGDKLTVAVRGIVKSCGRSCFRRRPS